MIVPGGPWANAAFVADSSIGRSWATGKTILFVTHNVEEAVFLGDRCCMLSRRPGPVGALVPVPVPRTDRTWQRVTSELGFEVTKEQVVTLVRDEVRGEERE